jgi:hypothetical protein
MCAVAPGAPVWRNPITGIAACCARAASGHAAAPKRDERTPFHCQVPPALLNKRNSTPGTAALRDFNSPYVGLGSIASGRYFARGRGMSASRLKADKEASMALSLLCAISRREQVRQHSLWNQGLLDYLVGTREQRVWYG